MKVQLIDDWKQSWRLWSVRFAVALAVVPELLYRVAVAAEHLLPTLSYVVVDNLPPWLRSVTAIMALTATLLRLLKQPPSGPPPRDTFGWGFGNGGPRVDDHDPRRIDQVPE